MVWVNRLSPALTPYPALPDENVKSCGTGVCGVLLSKGDLTHSLSVTKALPSAGRVDCPSESDSGSDAARLLTKTLCSPESQSLHL